MKWEYKNIQLDVHSGEGVDSIVSNENVGELEKCQSDGWVVFNMITFRKQFDHISHLMVRLRRKIRNGERTYLAS